MTIESLLNSCINQLDSRLPFHCVSQERARGLNRIYSLSSHCYDQPFRGHVFRPFETPLTSINITVSQIIAELGKSQSTLPDELNTKLIAIYEQVEIEKDKILKSNVSQRVMQTSWAVMTALYWHTARPDWAAANTTNQSILPEFQERICRYFLKNLIQVNLVYSDLFLPLLKQDLNNINLILSVPLAERVSVFDAFQAFNGKSISGCEEYILQSLLTIASEDRSHVASAIASIWMPEGGYPESNYGLRLFGALSEVTLHQRKLFCERLQSFIQIHSERFKESNKVYYTRVADLVGEVFFTEDMTREELDLVFERVFAIPVDQRSSLGELGYALKRKGFELQHILNILDYASTLVPKWVRNRDARASLYKAIAHCMNPDQYGKKIGDDVILLFQQRTDSYYRHICDCLVQIFEDHLSSETRANFFTALFNISIPDNIDQVSLIYLFVEKNYSLKNGMSLNDIQKLLESLVQKRAQPFFQTSTPQAPSVATPFVCDEQRDLQTIFQEKFSSIKELYACWRRWALKNHPDRLETSEAHEEFTRVSLLKDRCEALLRKKQPKAKRQ